MINYRRDIEPNKLSNRKDFLHTAIGRKLTEIERFFVTTPEEFLEEGKGFYQECDYFSFDVGATQFCFEGGLNQKFIFYSGGAPIIRFPEVFTDSHRNKHQLSQMKNLASEKLKSCLGKVCEDVRIWTYSESESRRRNLEREKELEKSLSAEIREEMKNAEDINDSMLEEDEKSILENIDKRIKELEERVKQQGQWITDTGVSYLFPNGEEIIYCCSLYDSGLGDRLLFVQDLNQEYIHSCFSLGQDKYIIPPKQFTFW